MKSSGISSANENSGPRSSSTPPYTTPPLDPGRRRQFALTGPSARLDPRTHAVRGDLADVRLADQVFAPHYAQPITCHVSHAAPLTARADGVEVIAQLRPGDTFELLELAGGTAWGRAPAHGLVGYCDRTALG